MEAKSKRRGEALAALKQSGFPFQLALEKAINELGPALPVGVAAREVPWASGYVDLLIDVNSFAYCVVECKRLSVSSQLAFAQPIGERFMSAFPVLCLDHSDRGVATAYLIVDGLDAAEHSVSFCVSKLNSRGAGAGEGRSLEKLASDAVLATEWLAERTLRSKDRRLFFPVIATNLPILVLRFPPGDVSLVDGELPDLGSVHHDEVAYVRFQKPLDTSVTWFHARTNTSPGAVANRLPSRGREVADQVSRFERAVWIVNAQRIDEFLRTVLRMDPYLQP